MKACPSLELPPLAGCAASRLAAVAAAAVGLQEKHLSRACQPRRLQRERLVSPCASCCCRRQEDSPRILRDQAVAAGFHAACALAVHKVEQRLQRGGPKKGGRDGGCVGVGKECVACVTISSAGPVPIAYKRLEDRQACRVRGFEG